MKIKRILRAAKRFLTDWGYRRLWYLDIFPQKSMDAKRYLELRYEAVFKKKLNLENPTTFNEKMQWLKLYDQNPLHTEMVDKYLSKKIVSDRIGDQYITKLLGVWDNVDEIDVSQLPEKFVLKTTHDCGGVVICKDKESFSLKKAKKFLRKHMKREYFYHCREWPYKNVKPRIIAEEFLQDGDNSILPVYKILCFDGEPRIIQTIQNDKKPNETIDYFDPRWNLLDLRQNYPNSPKPLPKPEKLEEMLSLAKTLAEGKSFIRVDLYSANGKIYFSEFTFFSDAGFAAFHPEHWDQTLGDWITLPQIEKQ